MRLAIVAVKAQRESHRGENLNLTIALIDLLALLCVCLCLDIVVNMYNVCA